MATKPKSIRDKYKATKVADLKKTIAMDDQEIGSKGKSSYHKINQGSNRFRLYPPHEGEKDFYQKRGVHWLTFPSDQENSDKATYRGTVPNSRIHGGTPKDVVEEYVRLAGIHLKGDEDDDKLKKMTDWQNGLGLQISWVAYADRQTKKEDGGFNKEFAELEMNRTVRDGVNALSTVEDGDEPIEIDPFTDADDGMPVIVNYDKAAQKSKRYSVTLAKKASPLTDEELEKYDTVTPLSEKYGKDSYTKEDFDKACEGLQFYDEENEINMWETEEWETTLEEIASYYEDKPKVKNSKDAQKSSKKTAAEEDEDEDEEDEKPTKKSTKKVVKKDEDEEDEDEEDEEEEDEKPVVKKKAKGDKFDDMDRDELKAHNKKKELGVKVLTSMSDDDLRKALRKAEVENMEEETEEVEEDEEDDEDEKPVKKGKKIVKKDEDEDEEDEEEAEDEDDDEDEPKAKPKMNLKDIKAKLEKRVGKK